MDGMEQKLGAILSDPSSMSKIMELAKGLGLNPPSSSEAVPTAQSNSEPTDNVEQSAPSAPPTASPVLPTAASLGSLLSAFGGNVPDDKQTTLLKALRPYLRPERRDRLDRAVQTARMVKAAKQAMKQFSL